MKYKDLCWVVKSEDVWFNHHMVILHDQLGMTDKEMKEKEKRLKEILGE